MSIKQRLMSLLKENKIIFTLLYSIEKSFDHEFQKFIRAMIGEESTVLMVEGDRNLDNEIFYIIDCGLTKEDMRGFFALIRQNIRSIYFAEVYHFIPCIAWGSKSVYYDLQMDSVTNNAFEYYFEPIAKKYSDVLNENRFIISRSADIKRIPDGVIKNQAYKITDDEIEKLALIYRKYFHLNKTTQEYINSEIRKIVGNGERLIGVHVRGTDFKNQFNGHPKFSGFEPFIIASKKLMEEGKYNKIFIATEDEDALELFKNEFGKHVVFYRDCKRMKGKLNVSFDKNASPYRLGLDVLRDVYTLVHCDSLVCGLSQVAFAAQYIKKSRNEKFTYINQIQMSINTKGNDAQEFLKKVKT